MLEGLLSLALIGFLRATELMGSVNDLAEFHGRLSSLIDSLRGMFEDREIEVLRELSSLRGRELEEARSILATVREGAADGESLGRLWERFLSILEGAEELEEREDAAKALGKLALASAVLAACEEAGTRVSGEGVVRAVHELLEVPFAPLVTVLAEGGRGLPSLADLASGRVYRWPAVDEVLRRAERGESLILIGPAASGKTYSLATAGWELTIKGRLVFYVNAQVGRAELASVDVGEVRRRLEEALDGRVGRSLVRRMVFILDRAEAAPRDVAAAFDRIRRAGAVAVAGTRRSLVGPWERENPLGAVDELSLRIERWELERFARWLTRRRGWKLSDREVANLVEGAGFNPLFMAELVRSGERPVLRSPEDVRGALERRVLEEISGVMEGRLENWPRALVLLVAAALYTFQAPFDARVVREALRPLLRGEDKEIALGRVESGLDWLAERGYLQRTHGPGGRFEHVLYHKEYARLLLRGVRHGELRPHLPPGDWGEESFLLEVWRSAARVGGAKPPADYLVEESSDSPLALRVLTCVLTDVLKQRDRTPAPGSEGENEFRVSAPGAARLISWLRALGLEGEARRFALEFLDRLSREADAYGAARLISRLRALGLEGEARRFALGILKCKIPPISIPSGGRQS